MYTSNLFCYGHQLALNKTLNNSLREFDLDYEITIGNLKFECSFPYHGGQCSGDIFSCVLGTIITDDDNNKNYIKEIREAQESKYSAHYNTFLDKYIDYLKNINDKEIQEILVDLKSFTAINIPGFYSVEISS